MQNRCGLLEYVVLVGVLLLLLTACNSGSVGDQVTIQCDACETVELWETSHATRIVGEVKPGDTGVTDDSAWSALEGCQFYHVVVGDQEGWVCEDHLAFE